MIGHNKQQQGGGIGSDTTTTTTTTTTNPCMCPYHIPPITGSSQSINPIIITITITTIDRRRGGSHLSDGNGSIIPVTFVFIEADI